MTDTVVQYYNLGHLFEHCVARHGARPALRYGDVDHSFQLLQRWADSLAALLLDHGLRAGDVIMIGHTKRPLSYALMLAALRLGVAYVNIDVTAPLARNARILAKCGASLVFYDDPSDADAMVELAGQSGCATVELAEDNLAEIDAEGKLRQIEVMRAVDGATIAYIMFTSGSTGEPKGVAVTHQNVLHFIAWGQSCFGIVESDVFANLSPMYFDNSVFDFFVGLFSGACLCPVPRELLAAPHRLTPHLGAARCSIWFSVPSLLIFVMAMKVMKPAQLPQLRCIAFGGEGYPKVELKKLFDLFSGQAELINVYGPTECTCICSAYRMSTDDFASPGGLPPLGRLNQNFDHMILDEHGEEAELGELCLIGPNVAAGYFNDPQRTRDSFTTLETPRRFMKRMYRTGDIVERIDDLLHFRGRRDNQIKHMGYRIELEEIEHALARHPDVTQAAVIYRRSEAGYGKLFGFVACDSDTTEWKILNSMKESIPGYMVPSRIFIKLSLPKNANGKIDRQKLQDFIDIHEE